MDDNANKQVLIRLLCEFCEKKFRSTKNIIADRLSDWITSEAAAEMIYERLEKASDIDGFIGAFVDELFIKSKEYVSQDSFREMVMDYLEKFKEEKTNNPMVKMMAGFAEATDLINIQQAADIIQSQCIRLAEELEKPESEERKAVFSSINDTFKKLICNDEFKKDFYSIWSNCTERNFYTRDAVLAVDFFADARAKELVHHCSCRIVEMFREILVGNQRIKCLFNDSIYQITGRGALQAQEMLGDITRDVLGSLTDEQMNHLIYDKAEPDLLWIRMNGSIVGAIIGLCIFVASIIIEGKIC